MIQVNYNYLDLTGKRFGRLECLIDVGRDKGGGVLWECQCDCGKKTVIRSGGLVHGHTKSCGCLQRYMTKKSHTIHSLCRDENGNRPKLYHVWDGMKQRCQNPNSTFYKDYGGRGIKVCEEWNSYIPFHNWAMANGYEEGLTIERKYVNGDYEPSNCIWIPRSEQSRNRRNNHYLTYKGISKTITEWGSELGINPSVLGTRIRRGWSVERTLNTPVKEGKNGNKSFGHVS
jgi:hypothetical protein